jgi:hypothetical protein
LTAIPILLRLERVPDSGSDVGSAQNTLGLLLLGIGSMGLRNVGVFVVFSSQAKSAARGAALLAEMQGTTDVLRTNAPQRLATHRHRRLRRVGDRFSLKQHLKPGAEVSDGSGATSSQERSENDLPR